MQPDIDNDFGSCAMKIDNRKAEAPIEDRGRIARAYLYMDYNIQDITRVSLKSS